MEQQEVKEPLGNTSAKDDASARAACVERPPAGSLAPQACPWCKPCIIIACFALRRFFSAMARLVRIV